MKIEIELNAPKVEITKEKCACGKSRWKLPSGEIQRLCPDCEIAEIDSANASRARQQERLRHLTRKYFDCSWESVGATSAAAYSQVKNWVDSWLIGNHLLMIGSQGTGKTCAARLACLDLWRRGADTYYITAIELYQAYLNKNETGDLGANSREILYYANSANLLVIDEAGYLTASEAARQFFRTFHVRLHDSGKKSFIIISNIGREGLGVFFDRSRLDAPEVTTVIFNGESMRVK